MQPLLYLAHRLPYPPNKGDKVRSYNFLKHLAKRYDIHLGTFIDDPADTEHLAAVRSYCAELHVERIVPLRQRLRSLSALLTGEALTLPYFRSRRLAAWVAQTVQRHGVRQAFVCSSAMAQYVLKTGWEIVMTPVTYKVVAFLKRVENEDYYDRNTDFTPFSVKV